MHRPTVIGVVIGIAFVAVAMNFYLARGIEVAIPLSEIQSKIDARLPLVSKSGFHLYRIDAVRVEPSGNGRMHVDGTFHVEFAGRTADGEVAGFVRPAYRSGSFFLDDLKVEKMDVKDVHLGENDVHVAKRLGEELGGEALKLKPDPALIERALTRVLADFLERTPVYSLDGYKVKQAVARLWLKEVKITDTGVVAVLDPLSRWK